MSNITAIRLSCDEPIDEGIQLKEICLGNEAAFHFCLSYLTLCQLLDDVVDGEKVEPEKLIQAVLNWSAQLSANSFYLANKEGLFALIAQGASAWLDSDYCGRSEKPQLKLAAHALKSFYGEVIYHVAFILGGYEHMRKCSLRWRAIDPE